MAWLINQRCQHSFYVYSLRHVYYEVPRSDGIDNTSRKLTGNAQGHRSGPSCVFLDYFQITLF